MEFESIKIIQPKNVCEINAKENEIVIELLNSKEFRIIYCVISRPKTIREICDVILRMVNSVEFKNQLAFENYYDETEIYISCVACVGNTTYLSCETNPKPMTFNGNSPFEYDFTFKISNIPQEILQTKNMADEFINGLPTGMLK